MQHQAVSLVLASRAFGFTSLHVVGSFVPLRFLPISPRHPGSASLVRVLRTQSVIFFGHLFLLMRHTRPYQIVCRMQSVRCVTTKCSGTTKFVRRLDDDYSTRLVPLPVLSSQLGVSAKDEECEQWVAWRCNHSGRKVGNNGVNSNPVTQ